MKPSRVGRAGLPTPMHIILAGAPSQTSLLHSSEVSHEYLPAFRRFFKLDSLTAARPGPVPVGNLSVGACGSGDSISNRESPWRELPLKRKYPGTTDSEARRRRIVRGTIAEEGIAAPKHPTLTQGLENTSVSFTSATSVDPTSEVVLHEGAEDDEAAAAQLLHDESAVTSFNRSHERPQTDGDDEVDVDFLNHSFICYQTTSGSSPLRSPILSSPLSASSVELEVTTSQFPHLIHEDSLNLATNLHSFSTSFHTSFNSVSSSYEEDNTPGHPLPHSTLPPLPPLSTLTDLEDLPTPKELEKIQSHNAQNPFYRPKPISSIVGIISASQPILCRNKSEMVKLTVGDETASGVGLTIWLDSGSVDMRDKLSNNKVRSLDVVILRNVILNTFMGKVYLNSMRNGKTEIEVLYRCGERGGRYRPDLGQKKAVKDQQVEKVKRVVEWVESFVGVGGWNTAGAEDGDTTILPEDTQLCE
ncbi:hypothetical protein BGX38DRAFT_656069 [Terfezia claveryi]|nr:hypothetical protein BGX38DRAFT_656069 [Terfezia claveryi]